MGVRLTAKNGVNLRFNQKPFNVIITFYTNILGKLVDHYEK